MSEVTKVFHFPVGAEPVKVKEKTTGVVVTNGTMAIFRDGLGLEVVLAPEHMLEIDQYLQVIAERRILAAAEVAGRA